MPRFARMLDRDPPESGGARARAISEIEDALIEDIDEIARDAIESRIRADPLRAGDGEPR